MVDIVHAMWCDQCQRDVPVLRQPDGGIVCPQCGSYLAKFETDPARRDRDSIPNAASQFSEDERQVPPGACDVGTTSDAWFALESRLRALQLALEQLIPPHVPETERARRRARRDLPHDTIGLVHWHRKLVYPSAKQAGKPHSRDDSSAAFWGSLALGLMAFVCGAILLGWSVTLDRPLLAVYGVPSGAVGLGFLLVAALVRQKTKAAISPPRVRQSPRRSSLHRRRRIDSVYGT